MSADDWFQDFGGQSARAGGNWFAPGVYDVTLNALHRRTSQNSTTKGNKLIIGEFTVDQVVTEFPADPGVHPQGEVDINGRPKGHPKGGWPASNKRGEKVSWVQNPTKHSDTAYSNVKGLLLAIARQRAQNPDLADADLTPEQWREALLQATEPPGTALAGVTLRVVVSKTRTRADTPFTPVVFHPIIAEVPQGS